MTRTHREEADGGFTLVELLVVIILMGVVGTLALMGTTRASQGTRQAQQRVAAETELERVLQRVTRDLRSADPLVSATASSVSMTVFRNATCYRLTLTAATSATGMRLTQTTQPLTPAPTAGIALGSCTTLTGSASAPTVLARRLASTNVFTYQNRSGGAPATVADVASVRITLTRTLPENRPSLTKTTQVTLRNQGTDLLRSN